MVKNPTANAGDIRNMGLIPGLGRPLEKGMATHSSILAWEIPGKNGQKSLAGYSPWGCKESDMTEQLRTTLYQVQSWLSGFL